MFSCVRTLTATPMLVLVLVLVLMRMLTLVPTLILQLIIIIIIIVVVVVVILILIHPEALHIPHVRLPCSDTGPQLPCSTLYQQPKSYPHPRIPAARLFFVILCFSMFSSTWGNPEVGGGDNFLGSYFKPVLWNGYFPSEPAKAAQKQPPICFQRRVDHGEFMDCGGHHYYY